MIHSKNTPPSPIHPILVHLRFGIDIWWYWYLVNCQQLKVASQRKEVVAKKQAAAGKKEAVQREK
eukprot:NODE_4723_length_453_cov_6.383663_g4077_i0.p2 GENE.NODE_4723_length_453_cov_6.383663_g4077_i0~~NODE_4723_length_453_cov_6.383663_g4077_i0.p2  ORF type:complete len:65 (-),score=15.25 NODE_4723_length_453_cov_6.383663_g4077_i0:39-233(-)